MGFKFKYLLILLVKLMFCEFNFGQDFQQSVSKYLGESMTSQKAEIIKNYSELNRQEYTRLPLMEKIEFRTETERLEFGRQEFLIRTSFNTPAMQKSIFNKYQSVAKLRQHELENINRDELLVRYKDIIQWMITLKNLEIQKEKLEITDLYINKIQRLFSAGMPYDPTDYLNIKRIRNNIEIELIELSAVLNQIPFTKEYPGLADISGEKINISVQFIQKQIEKFEWNTEEHPEMRQIDLQLNVLNNDFIVEKSKSNKVLDFLQARYTVREDLLFENRFSVSMGLQIPWRGSLKVEKIEYRSRTSEKETEKRIFEIKLRDKVEAMKEKLMNLINQYSKLNELLNDEEINRIESRIMTEIQLSPGQEYKLQMERSEINLDLNKKFNAILEAYLDLLHESGKLYQNPLKNYLDPLLSPLE